MRRALAIVVSIVSSSLFLTATPAAAASRNPVIFVHGFSGAAWNFNEMINDFKRDGWRANQLFAFGYNFTQSNKTTASKLAAEVSRVRRVTGAARVDVVTHSMGGVSSRWYLKFLGGQSHVDDWVSMGGPNHGTNLSSACSWALASCREIVSGSAMLRTLNGGEETPGRVRYGTFWSRCDVIINPDSSARLTGAVNTDVGCVGHGFLLTDNGVSRRVRDFVR
jgi:triacylglycerol lipase